MPGGWFFPLNSPIIRTILNSMPILPKNIFLGILCAMYIILALQGANHEKQSTLRPIDLGLVG